MYIKFDKKLKNKSKSAATSIALKKSNVKQVFEFNDNRAEAVTQRELCEISGSHSSQYKHSIQKQKASNHSLQDTIASSVIQKPRIHAAAQVCQLGKRPKVKTVTKYKSGRWYSPFDPYRVFPSKLKASNYHKGFQGTGRTYLSARVPTLYTFTHTKVGNKLSKALQGPHTVAHRVILESLINAKTKLDVKKIFDTQLLSPNDVYDVVFSDEIPKSGQWSAQLRRRLIRYYNAYNKIYTEAENLYKDPTADIIDLKHKTNELMNLDPFATYGWKTITKASKKSLKGKGESKVNPSFSDLYDKPNKNIFKDQDALQSFINVRKDLFDANF